MDSVSLNSISKKILSVILAFILAITLCPAPAFADEQESSANDIAQEQQITDDSSIGNQEDTSNVDTSKEAALDESLGSLPLASPQGEESSDEETDDGNPEAQTEETKPVLVASAHVQNKGWENAKVDTNAEVSTLGVSNQSLRLEAMKLSLDTELEGDLVYSAHVQNIGWITNKKNGEVIGTEGKGYRIEAFSLNMTGELAEKYDIYYRGFVQDWCWLAWAKNGEKIGSEGYGNRLETVQVKIVKKGDPAPDITGDKNYAFKSTDGGPSGGGSEKLNYQVHVQNIGWQNWRTSGEMAGTSGKGYRLEGLRIRTNIEGLDINYSTHVQNIGWQEEASNGEMAGTSGKGYRLEALQINLSGSEAENYDIYYRTHVQNIGWLAWAKNGEYSGSEGYGYRLEALEIVLVEKGQNPPEVSEGKNYSFVSKEDGPRGNGTENLLYSVHVQNIGWQDWRSNGEMAGTSGKGYRLEALKIKTNIEGLDIDYSTHIQNIGWQEEVSNGEMAGTSGKGYRLEALQISLSGSEAENYDIYYRTHVQNIGWLAWAKNGEYSGSEGYGYRLEAIEIVLAKKDEDPNLNTSNQATSKKYTRVTGDDIVNASAHVQDIGWQLYVGQNELAGTTGQSKRIEAIKFNTLIPDSGIAYSTYLEGIGWQSEKQNNEISGTLGQSRRVEAFKVSLTGKAAEEYDIYYRAHVSGVGWLDWAKNGEPAGTAGLSARMEAFEFKLVEKGGEAPGSTQYAFLEMPEITVNAYVEGVGWQSNKTNGQTIGTTGQGKSLTAFKATVNSPISGGIEYKAYIANKGWTPVSQDGVVVGSEDGDNIEAIALNFTGDLAKYFNLYYSAHCAEFGWLGWAKNGSSAGTTNSSLGLQAFQVKPRFVGLEALENSDSRVAYTDIALNSVPSAFKGVYARAYRYTSATDYMIMIYKAGYQLGVFKKTSHGWQMVEALYCTIGKPSTPTPSGESIVCGKHYYAHNSYYRTDCANGYFAIHSVLHGDWELGTASSNACVRINRSKAVWIYSNIPWGTKVVVY